MLPCRHVDLPEMESGVVEFTYNSAALYDVKDSNALCNLMNSSRVTRPAAA